MKTSMREAQSAQSSGQLLCANASSMKPRDIPEAFRRHDIAFSSTFRGCGPQEYLTCLRSTTAPQVIRKARRGLLRCTPMCRDHPCSAVLPLREPLSTRPGALPLPNTHSVSKFSSSLAIIRVPHAARNAPLTSLSGYRPPRLPCWEDGRARDLFSAALLFN